MPKKKEEINLEESKEIIVEETKKKKVRKNAGTVELKKTNKKEVANKTKDDNSKKRKKSSTEVKKGKKQPLKTEKISEKTVFNESENLIKESKNNTKKIVAVEISSEKKLTKNKEEIKTNKNTVVKPKVAPKENVVSVKKLDNTSKKEAEKENTKNNSTVAKIKDSKDAKSSESKKISSTKKVTKNVEQKDKTIEKSSKENESSKKSEKRTTKKVVNIQNIEKMASPSKKEKEETIIEKIKSFISKIIAMQEEAEQEETKKEKKTRTKKTTKKSKANINDEKPQYLIEYYDLPYRYNETIVKILAQTPKKIFVYWDISDNDRIKYVNAFGEDFFEKTYPVLLLHNEDRNYTREIIVNDFANSWYIDIDDPKTKYTIQLGRKFREIPKIINIAKLQEENVILYTDYLPIATSNKLEVPNDKVLFESMPKVIKFRNVKTYEEKEKVISEYKTQYGKIYDIKEFYQEMYKEEFVDETLDINNPTSGGLSSSYFK